MRVLGIDIGMKRTGLAMSDELGLSVSILPNLLARSRAIALEKLLCLVKEFDIKVIVIGIPEGRSDYSKSVISRVLGLSAALKALFAEHNLLVQVVHIDESYSSKNAMSRLVASGVPQKQRKIKLDGAAAAIIVEDFLYSLKA